MRGRYTALAAISVIALALPAPQTAEAADTIVTFTVTGGAMNISAPAGPVNVGSGPPGTNFGAGMGTVTVSDLRGNDPSSWTATVTASAFTAALTGVPAIPASAMTYTPGGAATNGNGTLVAGATGTLANSRVAYSYSGGTGSSTTTWSPDLHVDVPATATATNYTGEVTHSVA